MPKFLIGLFAASALYAQLASIEGLTVNSATNEPIPGVHVRLIAAGFSGVTAAYGATSDRTGRISIAGIRPGTYILAPERSGFIAYISKSSSSQVPTLSIRTSQQLTNVRIEMAPRAVLSGRVLDDHGDPIQGIPVSVFAVDDKDQPNYIIPMPELPTDDRGEFRVYTVSGHYYLQARAPNVDSRDLPEQRDGATLAPYRSTFYPSTVVKGRAIAVDAVGGKEIGGLEIRMSRQAGVTISGVVSGMPNTSMRPVVIAQWGNAPQVWTSSTSTATDAEGRFTLPNVQAAYYRLWAVWNGKAQMFSRPLEFKVDEADVANLELAVQPGVTVSGKLEAGDAAAGAGTKRTVTLESEDPVWMMRPSVGDLDADGAFTISGVPLGKYRVVVSPLPESSYVKSVVLDGAAGSDDMLDLNAARSGGSIKITLGRDAARLAGRILSEDGERNPNTVAAVLFSPVPVPQKLSQKMVVRPQPDGTYTIPALRPGRYRIMALDAFRNTGDNSSAILKLLEQAEEIELAPGATLEKNLRVPAREDANAKTRQ
jgi:hypothetical protein